MVLLLDDDDDFRTALAANLLDDGHAVWDYASPLQVPPLHSLEQISLLIVDYQMEGEDGLSFTDRFHAAHPNVPVVMLSAFWSEHLEAEVAARPYLSLRRKPIDYDVLAALMPLPG